MSTGVFLHGLEVDPDDILEWNPYSGDKEDSWILVRAGGRDTYRPYDAPVQHLEYIQSTPGTLHYRWPGLRTYVKQAVKNQENKP